MIFLKILYILCLVLILHSYLIYPLIVWICSTVRSSKSDLTGPEPTTISILMSVYNEEKNIESKLKSLYDQKDLGANAGIYIGSDASNDRSNELIRAFIKDNQLESRWHFFEYIQRGGKASVVNKLVEEISKENPMGPDHIFVLTDANVLMDVYAIRNLCLSFRDPEVGLVDSYMINLNPEDEGVAPSESFYISAEGALKFHEGQAWKSTIGPFGGCYAIRSNHFITIPQNYKVDDFFLAMNVFQNGQRSVVQKMARVYEKVSTEIGEEFKRKRRIAAGNFQNMKRFVNLWWPVSSQLSFSIFSHKILRWVTPHLFILLLLISAILASFGDNIFTAIMLIKVFMVIGILLLGKLGSMINVRIPLISRLYYFVIMNAALFVGFLDYRKGIKTGVWAPPKRT